MMISRPEASMTVVGGVFSAQEGDISGFMAMEVRRRSRPGGSRPDVVGQGGARMVL